MFRQIHAVCLKCLFSLVLLLAIALPALGQSTAAVTGIVQDTSDARIPHANVKLINTQTGTESNSQTNNAGDFALPNVMPGHYTLQIERDGFDTTQLTGITLSVGDNKSVLVRMKVGSKNETVTVDGSGLTINTTDASVSTVIDRKFVENIPLNGRSFQGLILLTPGAITNSPQQSSTNGTAGEFSIDGQRTESNYYTVDGVSANTSASTNASGAGITGSLPPSTALGTTQALVSVDALQEFRVEGSTYSAEFGRNPGGQFSMVTRSGTDEWHGSAFNYFRNDALDANNWFNDHTTPITRKSPEHQNDFGGSLGGWIPTRYVHLGPDKTFFFFSYEGLRLVQPVGVTTNYVPTTTLRQSAPAPLNQALNAFPMPTAGAPDLGNGLTEFISGWSNPSSVDSTSIRVDHPIGQKTRLFFRFSDTPSHVSSRGTSANNGGSAPSAVTKSLYGNQSYTFGTDTSLDQHNANEFRLNLTTSDASSQTTLDSFGGGTPVDLQQLQGLNSNASAYRVGVSLLFPGYSLGIVNSHSIGTQKQWNLVDTFSTSVGRHYFKFGVDWRRLSPEAISSAVSANYQFRTLASVQTNEVTTGTGTSTAPAYPVYQNFSLFIQDEWKLNPRLALSLGIRWDINPPPGVSRGIMPYTVTGLYDYSNMALAPQGTSLWNTRWLNLAPRLGIAYILNSHEGHETVVRGGGGVFFDTGQQTGSLGFTDIGFSATNYFGTTYGTAGSFVMPTSTVSPAIINPPTAPYGFIDTFPRHFESPYTLQWNGSLEQALGAHQSFTVSYVGANGRKLLEQQELNLSTLNPNFTYVYVHTNGLTSSYNSLQTKFQRQIAHGLQALASYTWAHSLDFGSYNAALPYQRGNSDLDVRNNLSAALSYDLPTSNSAYLSRLLMAGWGADGRLTARSAFPVNLVGASVTDPATGQTYYGGLNLVANQPLYLSGSQYPGKRRVNPAAFVAPPTGQYGSAPRNFVRGFDATQLDIALRRDFAIYERLHAQFRAEAFNILNHPSFGTINVISGNAMFGEATTTLAQSLGVLSPLYQTGAARSLQLSARFTF